MRIVYCIPSYYNSGGMERILTIKANYLSNLGYEIIIITTGQRNREAFFQLSNKIKTIDLNINYDECNNMPILHKFIRISQKKRLHRIKLEKVLNEIQADIVISMFTHELSFLYKIKDGSHKIAELHFSKHFRDYHNQFNHTKITERITAKILNWRDYTSAKKYERLVVLSYEDKKNWKNIKNIEVIYNPISIQSTPKTEYSLKQAIAVGRLCPQKGFDMLINIWSRLSPDLRKEWHLTIYGSGPDYHILQELINKYSLNSNISIHPPVNDIQKAYANSSIMCFTSRYEGFGLALTEAMANGLSCISFNCPCGPSEIISNNKNGLLVESFDLKLFTQKLSTLMQNEEEREKLGKEAYKSVHANYNIDIIMKKWIQLFDAITQ